jgi:putative tryptophan/tyrosine transport system substrate-binding protein
VKRRRFLLTSLAAALAAPFAAEAQYRVGKVPRVGILNSDTAQDARVGEFRDGLRELGYVEGQNLLIIYRWADGHQDRLPALADDLLASNVDVIVAIGASVWAAKRQTSTVPIVIAFSGDPVGTAMVSSLARPGGNITGLSFMSSDLAAKRLELLKQTFPRIARVAVLYLPAEVSTVPELRETEAAARTISVTLQPLAVRHPKDLEPLFAAATRERADALLVFAHAFAFVHRDRIIELAARQRLPTMYGWREFVDVGGLMSYGPNVNTILRRAAGYVDRILKGAKPGDLPIEQPTKFELIINLKTAKALGLTIPPSLLARADQVIE